MAPRFRGVLRLQVEPETGAQTCIVCDQCAKACPDDLINLGGPPVSPATRSRFSTTSTSTCRGAVSAGSAPKSAPRSREGAHHERGLRAGDLQPERTDPARRRHVRRCPHPALHPVNRPAAGFAPSPAQPRPGRRGGARPGRLPCALVFEAWRSRWPSPRPAPIVIDANSTPASARSEIRLELGDLLFGDERYWEAIVAYERAKEGAKPGQLVRAARGLLRSLLQVAEFGARLPGGGDTGRGRRSGRFRFPHSVRRCPVGLGNCSRRPKPRIATRWPSIRRRAAPVTASRAGSPRAAGSRRASPRCRRPSPHPAPRRPTTR